MGIEYVQVSVESQKTVLKAKVKNTTKEVVKKAKKQTKK